MSMQNELDYFRVKCGMTVREAAKRLGVDPSTLTRWRQKETLGDLEALACMAIVDGRTPDDFHAWVEQGKKKD